MEYLDKVCGRIQQAQELLLEFPKEPMVHAPCGLKIEAKQQLTPPQIVAPRAESSPPGLKPVIVQKEPVDSPLHLPTKISYITLN
ncbi:MAG TPA: hypothetical protein VEJ22_04870 [Nitrospirota bacterium]|nr:hypothetical protein [Nitrospirota bacterium]